MNIVITGKSGQLGYELGRTVPEGISTWFLGQDELDITDALQIDKTLSQYQPDILINAAAYTAVDKAEVEQAAAHAVNAKAVGTLAKACKQYGIRCIHISTDFVFSGNHNVVVPYPPDAEIEPKSVYGRSKATGEKYLREIYPENSLIIRVSWLYSAHGLNFVKTMLRLMRERDSLSIVNDQLGCPTWAYGLAQLIWRSIKFPDSNGILHWSDAGSTTWFGFAQAIMQESLELGLLEKPIELLPISTPEYPTPAARPRYSLLDSKSTCALFDIEQSYWHENLSKMLRELAAS